jgi:hypothetical protein
MFALALSDTDIFAVEDEDPDDWTFHYATFDPLTVDSFMTPSGGPVESATVNPATQAAWLIARGRLYAASRQLKSAVRLPFPPADTVIFDVNLIGSRYYVCCNSAAIWYYEREVEEWVQLLRPDPRPPTPPREPDETAAAHVARTSPAQVAYARKFPDFYKSFAMGDEVYFIGALGHIVTLRGKVMEEMWLDSGARLIHGYQEGTEAVLSADRPVAQIFKGSVSGGFELIFENEEPALHRTALHMGVRYIGAGVSRDYDGPNLFVLDGDELIPVETDCDREPFGLIQLISTGNVLWAIDTEGVFRLANGTWTLTEIEEINEIGDPAPPID